VETVFEKTSVVMPTYLLAFAVANYSHVNSSADEGLTSKFVSCITTTSLSSFTHPQQSRYWARPEYIEKGYAEFVSTNYSDEVFDYFEVYFNHSYGLPKQGMILSPSG
jgi:aminopeptidase N